MGRALEPPLDGVGTHTDPLLSRPGVLPGQAVADGTVCYLSSGGTTVFSSAVPTMGMRDQAWSGACLWPDAAGGGSEDGAERLADGPRNGHRQRRRFSRGQQ